MLGARRQVRAGDALLNILTGKLIIAEVTNDDLSDAKLPSAKCTCDQDGWKPAFEYAPRHRTLSSQLGARIHTRADTFVPAPSQARGEAVLARAQGHARNPRDQSQREVALNPRWCRAS